ncbi:MAG: carbon-nitrogen hydrolase family protein [Bacteroidota bacterium]
MKIQEKYKIATVQAAPVLFNKVATIQKVITLSEDAAKKGAAMVVFPESFIPAYPRGLSFGATIGSRTDRGREAWQLYFENSLEIAGKEIHQICQVAKRLSIYIVLGITEKDTETMGTLYCTMVFINANGEILGVHRKLKPTGTERVIWGEGNGTSLKVYNTELGRLGGLICWENYMPLARMALYQQGIQVYLAPTADARTTWQGTLQHIACEGRCFVIGCNQYVTKSMYPKQFKEELSDQPEELCSGGSAVYHPLGTNITEPVYYKEELLFTEINLKDCIKAKMDFDVAGHYNRPDIFDFSFPKS